MMLEIVILAYNCIHTLPRTLQSLINQSNQNFIVSVFDDGSSEDIKSIVKQYSSMLKINYYYFNKNVGCHLNRQRALEKIQTDYFLFLDSDDILVSLAVETIYNNIIDKPDILTSYMMIIGAHQAKIVYNPNNCAGKVYRTNFIRQYNISMSKEVRYADDGYYNFQCFELADKINCIPNAFYGYIETEGSITHTLAFQNNRILEAYKGFYFALLRVLQYKKIEQLKFAYASYELLLNKYHKEKNTYSYSLLKEISSYVRAIKKLLNK